MKNNQNQRGDVRPLTVATEVKTDYSSIEIKNFYGSNYTLTPHFMLYRVTDFMEKPMTIPGISLTMKNSDGIEEPFAVLTKSFGEFIGAKNCAYIDTNNCPFADAFIKLGIARDTGFTKESGFYSYPLWAFDEQFLRQIGGAEYEKYSQEYDDYMRMADEDADEDEDEALTFTQSM